eukprot:scaffold73274_cov39-Phaeocystis_antarctica.AAC.1
MIGRCGTPPPMMSAPATPSPSPSPPPPSPSPPSPPSLPVEVASRGARRPSRSGGGSGAGCSLRSSLPSMVSAGEHGARLSMCRVWRVLVSTVLD